MGKREKISMLPTIWTFDEWIEACPEKTYKRIPLDLCPINISQIYLDKCNSTFLASSGTTQYYVGILTFFRIDKDKIDEDPFFVVFDKNSGKNLCSGFIHHASYEGRTVVVPNKILGIIQLAGLSVDFSFLRLPHSEFGTLIELQKINTIQGIEFSVETAMEKLNQ